ncbi:MAG: hypothetical protein LUH15_08115 [Tannerellaceae bacterium]|nr:hypothetical protein [Tannerellaceae bacterium]
MNGLFNNNFYTKSNNELIFLKRVNAQILGEENKSVISVSLFGRDVLKSETLKKLLGENFLKENSSTNNSIKLFIPNSIRLTYEDGTEKRNEEFSLNMDKYGNYSFYLRKHSDFNKLIYMSIFLYCSDLFVENIYISPLTRNEQAIKIIEV